MKPLDTQPGLPAARDWPAYWLVCLERSIAEGNYSAAAEAQQELRRLGIEVTMRPLAKGREAASCR